jgi:sialic acid synthase
MKKKFNETYIIGEIGQNHNGSVDIAKLIIESAARPIEEKLFHIDLRGMDAVKLTKRDLRYELSDSQMQRPYSGRNSFGKTYGEHRAFLELNDEQHFELYQYAKSYGLDFVETLCAPTCTSLLKLFTPDYLKVASRDLTNLVLLEAMAETKIPMILSTGMADKQDLDEALDVITKHHSDIAILHCVSEYPTQPKNVNFNTIKYLLKNYGQYVIGFSDHTIGIAAPVAAVSMGAKIIEKHITLDRRMRGTDQAGSLGPDGLNRMLRDLRLLDMSFGVEDIFMSDDVAASKEKLARSIATRIPLKKGQKITLNDIHLLSPGDGFKWSRKDEVIGRTSNQDLPANEIIYKNHLA